MHITRLIPAILLLAAAARADSLATSTGPIDGTINGLRSGKLSLTLKGGTEKLFDLADISALAFDQLPKFTEAEAARDDPLKAAALYKALIPTLNKPELKLLAQARAIDPLDRNGNFTDAVTLFLEVYLSAPPAPSDALWKLRPTHLPAPTSKMLPDSAERIAAALKTTRSDDARKNLRTMLLQIYTLAGDTASAERLAREITTGITDDPRPTTPAPADSALTTALSGLESDLASKNYDRVLQQSTQLLSATTWTTENAGTGGGAAAQLFSLKARALEAQNQPDLAAAAWLRIPAHYPESPLAPTALLRASALQKSQNHPAAAQALLEELRTQYPASPEAANNK